MLSGLFRRSDGGVNGHRKSGQYPQFDGSGRGSDDCKSDRTVYPLKASREITTDGNEMVTEVTERTDYGIPMINGRPDRRRMIAESGLWFGGCSLRDVKRIRRFILRRCSDGGQLTHDQFLRFYQVLDLLWTTGFVAMKFHITKDETIHVTEKGRRYLAWLDKELGEETDCSADGEPILRTRLFVIGFDGEQ